MIEKLEELLNEAKAGRHRSDPDWLARKLLAIAASPAKLSQNAQAFGGLGALCGGLLENRLGSTWNVRVWEGAPGASRLVSEFGGHNLIPTQGATWLINLLTAGQSTPSLYIGLLQPVGTNSSGAMTSGSNTLTFSTAPSPALIVGQAVSVAGAGTGGAPLNAYVGTVNSSTSYALVTTLNGSTAANAAASVSSATVTIGPAFAISDTLSSRANFFTNFSSPSTLPQFSPGAPSGTNPVSRAGAAVTFTISGSGGTICGGTLQDQSAVAASYTSGNLIGEVMFTAGGGLGAAPVFQPTVAGNTVQVTVTFNVNAG